MFISEEKKIVELKDEELEKVSGGGYKSVEGPTVPPPPSQNQGAPSCYCDLREEIKIHDYSIKTSCAGCDYIENCVNKYIIK